MLRKLLAVASTVVLMSTGSNASTLVTLDLTGADGGDLNGVGSRLSVFDVDDVSGQVSAGSTYYRGQRSVITAHDTGIGVDNGRYGDSSQVDGYRGDDWLTFTFDSAVQLVSVTFGDFTAYTEGWFGWRFGDDDAFIDVHGDETPGTFTEATTYTFNDVVARSFSVAAFGYNDDFVVSSVTVAAVPLPASSMLLIGGLAGFAFMRRRKSVARS